MSAEERIHLEALLEGAIQAHRGYFGPQVLTGCGESKASCNCALARAIRWAEAELGLR